MTNPKADPLNAACRNTDREIYHTPLGSMYDDSIHVTEGGGIGINVGGRVIVRPLRDWHALASQPAAAPNTPRTAPLSCPNCHDETDCSSVDICNAVAEVYATPPVVAGADRAALADRLTKWVEQYALKVCPPGCLPLPAQEREISLFAEIVRALNGADRVAVIEGLAMHFENSVHDDWHKDEIAQRLRDFVDAGRVGERE